MTGLKKALTTVKSGVNTRFERSRSEPELSSEIQVSGLTVLAIPDLASATLFAEPIAVLSQSS